MRMSWQDHLLLSTSLLLLVSGFFQGGGGQLIGVSSSCSDGVATVGSSLLCIGGVAGIAFLTWLKRR